MKIIHNPLGKENPYYPERSERFPRAPIAGEPVTLGVETESTGTVDEVWASWRTASEPERRAPGRWIRSEGHTSLWHIELPAFKAREEVRYTIHARNSHRSIASGQFQFFVLGWADVKSVFNYTLGRDGLILICNLSGIEKKCSLHISSASEAELLVTYSGRVKPPGDHEASSAWRVAAETEEKISFVSDHLRIEAGRSPFSLRFLDREGKQKYPTCLGVSLLLDEEERSLKVAQQAASPPEEGFYGFGERYNRLNQRGSKLDIRVYEEYLQQKNHSYMPVPFFLSSLGYGHYVDTERYVTYDLAAQDPGRRSVVADLDQAEEIGTWYYSGTPREILDRFTCRVGRPAALPEWVFGPWMSSNEWNSQDRVMKEVKRSIEEDIPVRVVVIEAWSDEATFYIWNGAEYEPREDERPFRYQDFSFPEKGPWPELQEMIDWLHQRGIRVILWQIPVLKKMERPHPQNQRDSRVMEEKGFAIKGADGSPYRVQPPWFNGGMVVDFTNPEARDWWLAKRDYLLTDLKIDGFKTDGGEHLWGGGLRFADGSTGATMWNRYPKEYIQAYHNFVRERSGGQAVTFSRAGFTGIQGAPLHWAGDQLSTWEALRAVYNACINAGLSGIPFIGWDIGGFSGPLPTAELYLRSAQCATFSPLMQYHSEFNDHKEPPIDRTPWNIAKQTENRAVIPIYRFYAKLREQLIPYIVEEARHTCRSGEPLMRPLFLDWPEDPTSWQVVDQHCFGRSLLVAPVFRAGQEVRSVYLPPGDWKDFWSGTAYGGGQWIECSAPLGRLPVFVRELGAWKMLQFDVEGNNFGPV